MRIELNQSERAIALLLDFLVLVVISYLTFGSATPPMGNQGFWFYAALLSILVGTKLITPYYVKPVDAVAYAVPAFVALMLSNEWSDWASNAQWAYAIAVTLTSLVGICAFAALLFNGWGYNRLQEISDRLKVFVESISSPAVIYSPMMIFAMLAYHYDTPRELVGVAVAMLLTTTFSIGDLSLGVVRRLMVALLRGRQIKGFGTIAAYQKPGIYLLRSDELDESNLPIPIILKDKLTGAKLAYAIDTVGRDTGHLCRAIELSKVTDIDLLKIYRVVPSNSAAVISKEVLDTAKRHTISIFNEAKMIIGLVAPDTSVPRLFFEITNNSDLAIGRLVSVEYSKKKVLYQLMAGLTREEVVQQKNTYGFVRAQAQQVGCWSDNKFVLSAWLPDMHTPVHLEPEKEYQLTPGTIGRFPKTNYTAEISNIHQIVTHNTAILGILGVGKSMLAIELVERMLVEGIKVICLDLTNQYAEELEDYYCAENEASSLKHIQDACNQDSEIIANSPKDGGSLPNLKAAISRDLAEFLHSENPQNLKIYNPAEFSATLQENEPKQYKDNAGQWQRGAGLYSVTPVQATQIISEAALNIASMSMTDKAQVCLVYEEAHALVPEWNSVVVEGDKRATSGTARAILQGRKYGLGCLLISQRTANVTKTILNQCNTIFAMRTFDETGKEFLSNYLGDAYAKELSSLPERHAVFFGKGSNCENPVLIELNNRDDFRNTFRAAHPPPPKEELCGNGKQEDIEVSFLGDTPKPDV